MSRLLLEGTGSKRWSRCTPDRARLYVFNGVGGLGSIGKESFCFGTCLEMAVQIGFQLTAVGQCQHGSDAIRSLALERLHFAFAFNYKTDSHALHTTCTERGLHLTPQHGRELEAHDAVEHTPCLLGIDESHIHLPGMLDGSEDGGLGDFVEHDAARCFGL